MVILYTTVRNKQIPECNFQKKSAETRKPLLSFLIPFDAGSSLAPEGFMKNPRTKKGLPGSDLIENEWGQVRERLFSSAGQTS